MAPWRQLSVSATSASDNFVSYHWTDDHGGVGGWKHDAHGGDAAPGLHDLREEWGHSLSIFRNAMMAGHEGVLATGIEVASQKGGDVLELLPGLHDVQLKLH